MAKNQFDSESVTVEAPSGSIIISATCDPATHPAHCPVVWSRMSAVEIV